MMKKIAIVRERPDLNRLVWAAIKDASSNNIDGVERCLDILRYLKKLNLSVKDLRNSSSILPLHSLHDHKNPKIRMGVEELFKSWMKTLYSAGRISNNTCKSNPTKSRLTRQKKRDGNVQVLKKKEDERCVVAHETVEIKQTLKKHDDDCKSFSVKKKQSVLPMKLSKTSRSGAHEAAEIKQNLKKKKKQQPLEVSKLPKPSPVLKKSDTEMLELFEIAKKSADAANAKGLLAAKAETSICVDTLSLLISFPISSTATETRRIMEKLERLTKHKDRKICNSASELLYHWRLSIRDQQH